MRGSEASSWYGARQQECSQLVESYRGLALQVQQALTEAEAEADDARRALAQAYMPQLSAEALAQVARLTGFKGFSRRDPMKAMAHESVVLQRKIQEIQADERYQRRRWLVGAEGELTRQRAEVAELLDPWELSCQKYHQINGFDELLQVGYDTPAFSTDWWEPAYWRQWKTGDRICADLGVSDFGDDVLPEFHRLTAERDKWRAEVARWDGRIADVHQLAQEHDQAVSRRQRLSEIYWEGAVGVLAGFLDHADPALLEQWCMTTGQPDRGIQMGLRRVAGHKAKVEFLRELVDLGIGPAITGFEARLSKFGSKVHKYRRPKHARRMIGDHELDLGFTAKLAKYQARVNKLTRLIKRLLSYDAYDRFELSNPPELWWAEMTGKRPSSFTPRLQDWYTRHPQFNLAHDPSIDEPRAARAVATASAATANDDDRGYLS